MSNLDRRGDPEKRQMVITTGSWARGVIVVAVAFAILAVHSIVLDVLTAIIIASAIEPATLWLKRRKFPRLLSVLTIYILAAAAFACLFYFLLLPLLGQLSGFLAALPELSQNIATSGTVGGLFDSSGLFSGATHFSAGDLVAHVNSLIGSFSRGIFSSASTAFGGILSFLLIIVLSFYLSVQEDGVGKFLRVVTPWKEEQYIVGLWKRSQAKIGLWMQGQILLAVIIAVLVYLGLLLTGIHEALLLAVAAGFFEIIPLFGPILAAIPCVLIAFGQGGTSLALITAGLFLVIQQFENQLIYPLVVKKVVGVPPMVSILALLVGGELAGFLGIVISVPIAAILMEYLSDREHDKAERFQQLGTVRE
jgi:predicted PurR-regulated permease PerM